MYRVRALLALTLSVSPVIGPAAAQSLRVSPVTIDLPPGANSAALTLGTGKPGGVAVQARVFRWSKALGEDKLDRTADVVVSPPMQRVRPGSPSTVRIVRVKKAAVSGEETYRVILDEIPDRKKIQGGTVAFTIHQSIPVFFSGFDVRPPRIAWKASRRGSKLLIEAANSGQKHVRLRKLTVTDGKNHNILKIQSLAGYVLGGQTTAWRVSKAAGLKTLSIKAEGDAGSINASVVVGKGG